MSLLPQRFWDKVSISTTNFYEGTPCWKWTGSITKSGYGGFWQNEKSKYAHRLSYEDKHGEIPNELVINHMCRNRCCVNRDDHLEIITNRENIQIGISANRIKTHCKQGHEYNEENTYYRKNVIGRKCKICNLIYVRQYRHRKNS